MTTLIAATCELWVDGVRYPDGQLGEDHADPFVLSGLTVTWGRVNTIDQPAPATCTFEIVDPPDGSPRFDETVNLGSSVIVWAVLDGHRHVVFAGRVTDLSAQYDGDAAVCNVIAADQLADLANRFVGTEPWAMEQLWQRAARILTSVGLPTGNLNVATRPALLNVSRMDVDRQAATPLLQELAVSGGAVLWSAYNGNAQVPYLYFEDPATRASLYQLTQNVTTLLWAPSIGTGAGIPLSACMVLQDPVRWARQVGDLMTRCTVRWLDQATSPGTTERTIAIVDAGNEATLGARGISIGTVLTTQTDAQALAGRTLAAHQPSPSWRTEGLTWDLSLSEDDAPATRDLVRTLLDNVTRLGVAIALFDLPWWTPTAAATQLYIEGGTYEFNDGHWVLALQGAPATGLGGSMSYQQTDRSIRYADIDRSVSFLEMIGVGPAGPTGQTWTQQSTTWAAATGKWSDK